jgi:adenylate cyclase
MGSRSRFDYTAIGDSVNLASRLEGANKAFGTGCLCSAATWAGVGAVVLGREVGQVAVKGRAEPIGVHEPIAVATRATAEQRAFVACHAAALERLRRGDRAGAVAGFQAVLAMRPADAVAALYLERLRAAGWDGVFRLDSK